MCKITLKFNNIRVNQKEFHKSKQPVHLMSVILEQIVVSDKFKLVTKALIFYWLPRL